MKNENQKSNMRERVSGWYQRNKWEVKAACYYVLGFAVAYVVTSSKMKLELESSLMKAVDNGYLRFTTPDMVDNIPKMPVSEWCKKVEELKKMKS